MMINKRLINLCKDSKLYVMLCILSNWLSFVCNMATIILIGLFINQLYLGNKLVIETNVIDLIKQYKVYGNISLMSAIIIVIILLIIRFICNKLSNIYSRKAAENAKVVLRKNIYDKLLRLGSNYSEVESTSAVVQLSVEGVEQLEIYFSKYLPQFMYSLIVPITLFIFMSFISFKAALIFIIAVPLIPISIIAIMKFAKKILKDYWNSYSDLGNSFLENLQGLTTLKVFNVDEDRHKKMNNEAENFRRITMKVLCMQLNSITIMDLVAFGGAAAGTIVALIQFKDGQILAGSLISIILLSSEFFIPLRLLGSYFHIAMNGMSASDRIFNLLDTPERKCDVKDKNINLDNHISVELKDVSFSYDGKRQVLNNINMKLERGGVNAIVGESGSGKSTIASLIVNNYEASQGEIIINGTDINDLSFNDIYKNIGIVYSNSYIFNGTILDNLLISKKDATDYEIESALKVARLYDFVNGLEKGIMTDVGQAGSALSGGQKQRLALARIILSNRDMIIFDEATSNIDVESEEAIWEAIYELSKNKTILVITHRLANIKDAKNIYVLNQGIMVEQGNHEQLLDNKMKYYEMLKKQSELEAIREGC